MKRVSECHVWSSNLMVLFMAKPLTSTAHVKDVLCKVQFQALEPFQHGTNGLVLKFISYML